VRLPVNEDILMKRIIVYLTGDIFEKNAFFELMGYVIGAWFYNFRQNGVKGKR